MNKFILFAAIVVLALPLSVTRAYDMWTNLPVASCTFPFKYEGDYLPTANAYTNLGFIYRGYHGIYEATNEITMTIKTNGNVKYLDMNKLESQGGGIYVISNQPSWQLSTYGPWTVEFRVQAVTVPYGVSFEMHDGYDRHLCLIDHATYPNQIRIDSFIAYDCIATNAFHTYRVCNWSTNNATSGQRVAVWRDGVDLGEAAGLDASAPSTNINRGLLMGFVAGASAAERMYVDYLRWTTNGAYPWKADPPAGTILSLY